MKVLGIIAEYNPFHNGHIYHIKRAKEITGADYTVLVMSGNFTQTGNIAVVNKFERAKIVTKYGIDLVLELPTIYATSSAEYFAYGAVNLLNSLGIVDSICFGAEEKEITNIKAISKIILENENDIYADIKKELKEGITFAAARQIAISKYLPKETDINYAEILSKPNNILGIEYIKALYKLNSNIEPYVLYRDTANHSDTEVDNDKKIASATAIRNLLKSNEIERVKEYIPEEMYDKLINSNICLNQDFYQILRYKIATMSKEEIKEINGVTEGLENKIIDANIHSKNYEELVSNIKSKRYVETKIRRALVNIILDIKKDTFNKCILGNLTYAHVLAMNENGKKIISKISKTSNIPLLTSINDKFIKKLDEDTLGMINIDIKSSNIHSIISNKNLNFDFKNNLNINEQDT